MASATSTASRVTRVPRGLRPVWEILRAPFTRRTWSEALYLVVGLPFAAVAVVACAPLLLGAPLVVAFIGLPLVAATLVAARRLATIQRELAAVLVGERVTAPRPAPRDPGFSAWLATTLRDQAAWRAMGYFALKLPLSLGGTYAMLLLVVAGFFDLTRPLQWEGATGAAEDPPFTVISVDSLGGALAVSAIGAALLLAVPWVIRAFVAIDRSLVRRLLGPASLSARVRELEETRAHAVDQSAAQLRRIERDLHDGAQVRLAALAMTLGQIKEDLHTDDGAGAGGDRTNALVDAAHRNAKDALVELRDLVRGIHPPALDAGLEPALATLAASSAIPVTLSVDLAERPSPPIETIAYFCVAELLANAAKHSRADRVAVEATEDAGRLRVTVTDDGSGGARLGAGGGLAGLADRVRTVDGTVSVDSPPGGPTVIVVELPVHS